MGKDTFDAVLASVPNSATAGRVTSRGTHYEPKLKPGNTLHWDAPPPMRALTPFERATGICGTKFGRFTVIGLAVEQNPKKNASWVCRCVCGDYEVRKAKAIKNPRNSGDACLKCRKVAYLRQAYERLGSRPIEDFVR